MVVTAIATYITIVGIVYNVILRPLWDPQGWQKIADETLHSITPAIFILYWITLVDKRGLNWKNIFSWMIYPIAYLVYTLLRGEFTGRYPYPFVDVVKLGYPVALTNCLFMSLAFLAISVLFIAIGKALAKANK